MLSAGIKFALGLDGMSQQTIARIEAALPAAQRLLALRPEVEALYAKAKPDVDIVAPVLLEVMAFIQK